MEFLIMDAEKAMIGIRTYCNREGFGVGHTFTFTVTGSLPPNPHSFNTRRPIINAHGTCVERIYFVKLSNSALLQCATLCLRVFTKMKLNCKYKFCNKIILNFVSIIQILHKSVYYYF